VSAAQRLEHHAVCSVCGRESAAVIVEADRDDGNGNLDLHAPTRQLRELSSRLGGGDDPVLRHDASGPLAGETKAPGEVECVLLTVRAA
jgi:hypothetical protein